MKARNTFVRVALVGTATFAIALLTLWATGHFPPVALANSGGGVTYRTLTKCTPTGGTILNSPSGTTFVNNTVVTLTADPNPGYDFSAWTGSVTGSTNPINLTMNANKSVCATFVVDNTIPVITLTGSATVYVECGDPYTDAGATASDNRDGNITSRIVAGGDTVDVDTPGTYIITYNVQDDAENSATQVTRTVIVQDTGVPVITLVGAPVVYLDLNATYTEAGATALDDCEGALSGVTIDSTDVNTSVYGAYVVTYNISDSASNAAVEVTREVRVWPKLEIAVSGAGTTLPPAGQAHYHAPGTVVDIEAVDNWGGGFIAWSGGPVAEPLSAETTITLNSAQSITAAFGEAEFLPVTLAVEGEGALHYAASGGVPGTVTEAGGPVVVPVNPEDNLLWLESIPVTEETEFWQWLSDDPDIDQTYIAEGDFTMEGPTEIMAVFVEDGVIEYITANVEIIGEGTSIPVPGEYLVPRFAATDMDCLIACQDDDVLPVGCPPCEAAALWVKALPDADSVFLQWESPGLSEPVETEVAEIPMEVSADVIATFIERPGLSELDLIDDLGSFLVAVGEIDNTAEVYDLAVDYGELSVDENGGEVYEGNGIPDAVEIALLGRVLTDIRLNATERGGLANDQLWDAFEANRVRASTDLPTASDAAVNAIAAYMTLGSNGHVGQAKAWALAEYAVDLDARHYDRVPGDRLLPGDDADNDGLSNLEEWEATSEVTGTNPNEARLQAYTEWALDPELPIEAPPSEGEKILKSGEEDCEDFLPLVTITVVGGTVSPSATVPSGTRVRVKATNSDSFLYWHAPGTLIDGSGNAGESFVATATMTITAFHDQEVSAQIYANGQPAGSITGLANKTVKLPGGTSWYGNWGIGGPNGQGTHITYSGNASVILGYAGSVNKTTAKLNFTQRLLTHKVSSSGGGRVVMGVPLDDDFYDPMFLDSVSVPVGYSDRIYLRVLPDRGYYIVNNVPNPATYSNEPIRASAKFKRAPTLVLDVKVKGGGNPACAGTVSADTAKKYYAPGETVRIEASPRCGYAFTGWKGHNEYVWLNEEDVGDPSKDITIDLVTVPEIYVQFEQTDPKKKEMAAVFETGNLFFVNPNGTPVTDNHYVFSNGVCAVTPELGNTVGAVDCKYFWDLEAISGSDVVIPESPPNPMKPTLQYVGLPTQNSEFGDKNMSVSSLNSDSPIDTTIQIFFSPGGTDHPEILLSEVENWLCNTEDELSDVPNWYYYWEQTSAKFGSHVYNASGGSVSNPPWVSPPMRSCIGHDSWARLNYNANPNRPNIGPPSGANGAGQFKFEWDSSGIDTYAWVCRHEAMHLTVYAEMWPSGLYNAIVKDQNGNVVGDYDEDGFTDAYRDADEDWFPDIREPEFGYDPQDQSTNNTWNDLEDYIIWRQTLETPWALGSAKDEDWASPGQQSNE